MALIRSELDIKKKLSAQKPGTEAGIWIEQLTSSTTLGSSSAAAPVGVMPGMGLPGMMRGEPGMMPGMRGMPVAAPPPTPDPAAGGAAATASTNAITIVCRAVSLTSVDSSANTSIAYAVENEIKASPLVDPKATQLSANISEADANGTFTFTVNVVPLNPLNF